jgi:general secretion pathway protein A
MYETFYNLKEKPFNLTPDPRFIYFTEKHCEALANLVYGIRERKGFLVLTGEVGTGKTTLVNALLDTLERTGVLSAFIFNPLLTSTEFFEYLMKLNSILLERYRAGQVTVLVVDEAQNLSHELLEEIRLLTNLETATEKLLQIVLVGQPELNLKLNTPELRQLKQRVSLRCTLEPLSLAETKEYIRTRMEIAGLPDQAVFPEQAVAEIHRFSAGIPRLINIICDNALLTGYASDSRIISVEIIREVSEDLDLIGGHSQQFSKTVRPKSTGIRKGDNRSNGNGDEPGSASSVAESHGYDLERDSFNLFVQFLEKLRDRSKV